MAKPTQQELDEALFDAVFNMRHDIRGLDVIEALVRQHGADINAYNRWGDTPLTKSLSDGSFAITKKLVELGADIELPEKQNNMRPLHKTVGASVPSKDAFDFIIAAGADIHARSRHGFTALHDACNSTDHDFLVYSATKLLDLGVDINARNDGNLTPLHFAAQRANYAFLEEMVRRGANAHIRDNFGRLPFDYLSSGNYMWRGPLEEFAARTQAARVKNAYLRNKQMKVR